MISRRALVAGACACAAAACARRSSFDSGKVERPDSGDAPRPDTGADSGTGDSDSPAPACADTGAAVDGWVELPLSEYPDLATVGGFAYVVKPESLLQAIVAQVDKDCFVALWRICTHGACETEWDAEARTAVCPCHLSVFAEDGRILEGPATVPLRTFPVVRRGGSLWLQR